MSAIIFNPITCILKVLNVPWESTAISLGNNYEYIVSSWVIIQNVCIIPVTCLILNFFPSFLICSLWKESQFLAALFWIFKSSQPKCCKAEFKLRIEESTECGIVAVGIWSVCAVSVIRLSRQCSMLPFLFHARV